MCDPGLMHVLILILFHQMPELLEAGSQMIKWPWTFVASCFG